MTIKPEAILGLETPIGWLHIHSFEEKLSGIYFRDNPPEAPLESEPLLREARSQLDAYFKGKLKTFKLPLCLQGTSFQEEVWQSLAQIPYGQTLTYGALAKGLGNPKAIRAVGSANGKNPISIILPCHRVIGANGKLVGYGGGLWRKEWLLRHEGALLI